MRRHSPQQQVKEAHAIAQANGMFILELKSTGDELDYVLYRKTDVKNVRLGRRRGAAGIRSFVEKAAGSK